MFLLQGEGPSTVRLSCRKEEETLAPTFPKQTISSRPASLSAVASVATEENDDLVAFTQSQEKTIEVDDPFVKVGSLMGESTNLIALIDTGSSVSFVCYIYSKYIKPYNCDLMPVKNKW